MAAKNGNGKNDTIEATKPVMFTVRQALAHLTDVHGLTDVSAQAIRNAAKNRPEFAVDGAVTHEVVEGTDISVLRISRDALDNYANARKNGSVRVGRGGAGTGAGVYYRVRLTADMAAQLAEAYPNLTFEPASVRQRKNAGSEGDDAAIVPADSTEDHSEGVNADVADDAGAVFDMELNEG